MSTTPHHSDQGTTPGTTQDSAQGTTPPAAAPASAPGSEALPMPSEQRVAELARALEEQQRRIAELAAQTPAEIRPAERPVRLLPVTKHFPAEDVAALHRLGVRAVGENREQEASAKAELLRQAGLEDLEWHHIGQLQSKKAKSVIRYARWVHSLDRPSVVQALGRSMDLAVSRWESEEGPLPAAGQRISCLLQVDLDPARDPEAATHRGGAHPDHLVALAEQVAEHPRLDLAGIMAVAPLDADPNEAFERLHGLSAALREHHPEAVEISAGMSADAEAAIRWGSTMVRVGSAIMGARPAPPVTG